MQHLFHLFRSNFKSHGRNFEFDKLFNKKFHVKNRMKRLKILHHLDIYIFYFYVIVFLVAGNKY